MMGAMENDEEKKEVGERGNKLREEKQREGAIIFK